MPDVFLSYSREDQAIARRFASGFERAGFSVWWDQSLNPGEAFDQVTEQALEQALAVVVLWSKSSVNSRWVRAEATQATANQRLMPVMVETCKRPIMFELTHTADLSQWQGGVDDAEWQSFIESLRRFVQRSGQAESGGMAVFTPPAGGVSKFADKPRVRPLQFVRSLFPARLSSRRVGVGIICALAGAAVAAATAWYLQPRTVPEVIRFEVPLAGPAQQGNTAPGTITLSPDGRRIVYANGGKLYSQRLDQFESTPIPAGDNVGMPFFSPEGRSVAFFSSDKLKVFDFGSDSSRVLADVKYAPGMVGAWDDHGRIFFGQSGPYGLSQVAAVGGVPERFAALDKYGDLDYPDVLPGGTWVLFTAHVGDVGMGNWSGSDIVAQDVTTGERKVLVRGGHFARYLPTGHLVFARGGTLYAVAFDAKRMATRGREVPVVQRVATDELSGYAAFAIAGNGTLIYVPGGPLGSDMRATTVASITRAGEVKPVSAELRDYSNPRSSPDGSKVAVEVTGPGVGASTHIWVMDAANGAPTQLTFDGTDNHFPVWTADGSEVLFTAKRGNVHSIYRKSADGSGEARHLLDGTSDLVPTDVRGDTLFYHDRVEGNQRDVFTFDLKANGPPRPLLATPADESSARISPNGAWIAYVSAPQADALQGDFRAYVRPFPNTAAGGQRAISDGRGSSPIWSRSGNEIYYMNVDNNQVSVWIAQLAVTPTTLTPTQRRKLFDFFPRFALKFAPATFAIPFDVSPKNDDLIAIAVGTPPKSPDGAAGNPAASPERPHVNVVLNWFEELKKLVPAEGAAATGR